MSNRRLTWTAALLAIVMIGAAVLGPGARNSVEIGKGKHRAEEKDQSQHMEYDVPQPPPVPAQNENSRFCA